MVASLRQMAGLDWPVPDYSALCRRRKNLAVQIPYRRADGPVNLLVDSSGIKFLGDGWAIVFLCASGASRRPSFTLGPLQARLLCMTAFDDLTVASC